MEEYVALYYDSCELGRTIKCSSWEQAVAQCVQLAAEQGRAMTNEQVQKLQRDGDCVFEEGGPAVHIGGLEGPMDED